MIDQQTIDRIFDAADIVSVVSDYVSLHRRGANYWGNCPFHDEKTPSFSVSPAKNIYKCFGCGKGGNAVNFIMGVENLTYYEALKFLAKKFNIEVKERELTKEQKEQQNERESLMSLSEWVNRHFVGNLQTEEGRAVGMSYFNHRGFREDTIKKFQLGYAIDKRDYYTKAALVAGYRLDLLEKSGLTIVKDNYQVDRFKGRAIFPIHSISGRVIAFGGRAIKKDEVAKYQNSPESDIYHKSNVLYGLYFAKSSITKKKKCYIVEGYADVVSMVQAGVENIVAPCGTALTKQQIQQLRRILPAAEPERSEDKYVTLLYDGDSAGMHAALKNGKLLLEEGLSVKIVVLPESEDPDSFAQNHESSEVLRYLEENEQDYVSFKINYYLKEANRDPVKMAQLIEDVASTIEVIPDAVKRSIYTKLASSMLQMEEKVLCARINEINKVKVSEANGPTKADAISKTQSVEVPPVADATSEKRVTHAYDRVERELVHCVVRYGNLPIALNEEETVSVAEYILSDLKYDGIELENPLYRSMIDDYVQSYQQTGIDPKSFFEKSPNLEYGKIAMEELSEPYVLSRIFDKNNTECHIKTKQISQNDEDLYERSVTYAVCNVKSSWIQREINRKLESLKTLNGVTPEEMKSIMEEIMNLKECQREFDKLLGERHIRP
jgi:DNA primase